MTYDPTTTLYLERQFCSICRGLGKPGVRVADVRDRLTMTERGFRARRRAQARRHLVAEHPGFAARVGLVEPDTPRERAAPAPRRPVTP